MRTWMKAVALAAIVAAGSTQRAMAWDRGRARIFATLPAGASGPEGIEVDRDGNVYVATFGFTASGSAVGSGQLYVYDRHGKLLRQVSIAGSSPHLLGLAFHPVTGKLLVIDFGAGQVLDVDPVSGASTPFLTLPSPLPHPALGTGLNDLTFDPGGRVYVSDSFQGIVWTTGQDGGVATAWVDSPLLRTAGVPPFGANGLRFNHDASALFVANTGDDTVIKIPTTVTAAGPAAGAPAVFTNAINGADGLLVDEDDNLWVVANQGDEIVVVDPTGKALSKLGDFDGVAGARPIGLLFPASARFHGRDLLVTNLSLDLRLFNPAFETVDSEWCAQIARYTVVRIPARIRGFGERGDDRD